MLPNCKICSLENPPNSHYWDCHKTPVQKFFRQYYPKTDLLTGEELNFTSAEQWLLTDFKNKTNLKNYLKSLNLQTKKQYCKQLITRRKNIKDLKYSLSQVETKSLLFPSVQYLDTIFKDEGGYYEVSKNLGLINKFVDHKTIKKEDFSNIEIKSIICDSKEQNGLEFDKKYNISIESLDHGDYTSKLPGNSVFIERKSLSDFISTISAGLERFQREIERAFLNNHYIVVLVESELSKALSFNYLPYISRHTKASPEFIFSNLRTIMQNYNNIQFLFVNNRKEASDIIPKILSNQEVFKRVDLGLIYDLGLL